MFRFDSEPWLIQKELLGRHLAFFQCKERPGCGAPVCVWGEGGGGRGSNQKEINASNQSRERQGVRVVEGGK